MATVQEGLDKVMEAVNATATADPDEQAAAQSKGAVDALAVVTALAAALSSKTYADALVFAEALARLRDVQDR